MAAPLLVAGAAGGAGARDALVARVLGSLGVALESGEDIRSTEVELWPPPRPDQAFIALPGTPKPRGALASPWKGIQAAY